MRAQAGTWRALVALALLVPAGIGVVVEESIRRGSAWWNPSTGCVAGPPEGCTCCERGTSISPPPSIADSFTSLERPVLLMQSTADTPYDAARGEQDAALLAILATPEQVD